MGRCTCNGKEKGVGNRGRATVEGKIDVRISLNHKISIKISYKNGQPVHAKSN